jgi:hypothetical protein
MDNSAMALDTELVSNHDTFTTTTTSKPFSQGIWGRLEKKKLLYKVTVN